MEPGSGLSPTPRAGSSGSSDWLFSPRSDEGGAESGGAHLFLSHISLILSHLFLRISLLFFSCPVTFLSQAGESLSQFSHSFLISCHISLSGGREERGERHRSVRRVETDRGLLAAARVAVAAQRVGVVLEGVIGSTEAWAAPRLRDLVRQNSLLEVEDEIAVTDGEAHSAAVVCRRWSVPYLAVKEVLTATPTDQGRRSAGGRAAELVVRILRTYLPITLPGSEELSFTGADPLTPPVSARQKQPSSGHQAVIKPRPLKFEEIPHGQHPASDRAGTKSTRNEGEPQPGSRAYAGNRQTYDSKTSAAAGAAVRAAPGSKAAAAAASAAALPPGPPGPWYPNRDGGSGSWCAAAGVVVAALVCGCGLGFYLAASMQMAANGASTAEMRAAMSAAAGPVAVS